MNLKIVLLIASFMVGVVHCLEEEVETAVKSAEQKSPETIQSDAATSESAALPVEAREIPASHSPSRTNPKYQVQQINAIPSYPKYHRPLRYNPHNHIAGQLPPYQGPSQLTKEELSGKKAIPGLKHAKPEYFAKDSSYASIPSQPSASIPNQPSDPLSPRFVPDASQRLAIETVSEYELQQLTQPQPFGLSPHGVHLPPYSSQTALSPQTSPYLMRPQYRPEEGVTVKYEQTQHSFIDRMWGEVQTMRQTITEDYLGAIPNMLRTVWNYIVGAVSATSRMFDVGVVETVSDVSARMIQSVDWMAAFRLLVNQLT